MGVRRGWEGWGNTGCGFWGVLGVGEVGGSIWKEGGMGKGWGLGLSLKVGLGVGGRGVGGVFGNWRVMRVGSRVDGCCVGERGGVRWCWAPGRWG